MDQCWGSGHEHFTRAEAAHLGIDIIDPNNVQIGFGESLGQAPDAWRPREGMSP